MTPEERAALRQHVETWERAGRELEEIKRRELRAIDRQKAIQMLFGDHLFRDPSKESTSGLVEQQAWFAKLRE